MCKWWPPCQHIIEAIQFGIGKIGRDGWEWVERKKSLAHDYFMYLQQRHLLYVSQSIRANTVRTK